MLGSGGRKARDKKEAEVEIEENAENTLEMLLNVNFQLSKLLT